ncbi:unnamed protein product [Blepharisma stoltei]|uniref:Uncharacterized protein n=1 Tax=Blepharisma stoltei TaxID=1481888 RepID=A0AAU9JYQ6_9CILI|nr:unnamed protein product [Blepharisma stoltei]
MESSYDVRSGTKKTVVENDRQNSAQSCDENAEIDTNRLNAILNAEYLVSEEKIEEEVKNQKDVFELKTTLDELIDENSHKEERLGELLSICQSFTGCTTPVKSKSSSSRQSLDLHQNSNIFALLSPKSSTHILENEVTELKSRLHEIDMRRSEEAFVTKELQEMKAKEWKNLQIWKERVKEAINLQKEIDPKYDELHSSKVVAKNNFILAHHQTTNYISLSKNIKAEQDKKYQAQSKIRDELRNEIAEIVENIGQQSIISERKKVNYRVMIATLKLEIEKYEGSSVKEKENIQKVVNYREKLEIIKKIIKNYDETLIIVEPLDEISIKNIIQVYNEMSFQESSLSELFQELTAEEIKKNQACMDISKQLELLKADQNIGISPSVFSSTFNQKKMILDDKDLINFKSDHLHDIEKCLLKLFFLVLNFGSFLCNSFTKITKYSENNELDSYTIQKATKIISDLKKGFGNPVGGKGKRNNLQKRYTLMPNKHIHNFFKTDNIEASPVIREIATVHSLLSAGEVSKLYNQYFFDRKHGKKLSKFLTSNPIICYFLTLKQIDTYFQDQQSTKDILDNIWQLNQQAHLKLLEQFMSLSDITRDLIWQTSKNISSAKTDEFQEKSALLDIKKYRESQRKDTKNQKSKKNDQLSREESIEGSQNNLKINEAQKNDKINRGEDEFELAIYKSPHKDNKDDDSLYTEVQSILKFRSPPPKKIEIGGLSNNAVLQEMKDVKNKLKEIKGMERKANKINVENTKFFLTTKTVMFGIGQQAEEIASTQPTRPSTYSISSRKYRKLM